MRRVVWAVGLCVALLLLVGGGIALVSDRPPETVTDVADGATDGVTDGFTERAAADAPPRRAAVARAAEAPTVAETPAAPAAEADLARPDDVFVPPLPPDVFRDPLRESSSIARRHGFAGGTIGVGGRAGAGNAAARIEARGSVVDATSGTPIAGADLAIVLPQEERPWGYRIGVRPTGEDGTFSLRSRGMAEQQVRAAELSVRAEGFKPWRGPIDRDDLRIALARVTPGALSATITGRAADRHDRGLYRPFAVLLRSEFGASELQWTIPDADGRFTLEGLTPGRWWLRVFDRADQEWTAVRLARGTVASVALLSKTVHVRPSGGEGPRREVVVCATGGLHEREVVRAENGDGHFWRTTVLGGKARLELPRGYWTIVSRRGDETVRKWVEVVLGSGPQIVSLDE